MFRRFKRREKDVKVEDGSQDDPQERIIMAEERFMKLLGPFESHIMHLQGVLTWEKPQHSAAYFLGVNVLFWMSTSMRIYYLIGLTGVSVTFFDLWSNHIWPEIRVPLPAIEEEDWVPVHPQMITLRELSHHLAVFWECVGRHTAAARHMHRAQPAKFFVYAVLCFVGLAVFGHYVPGIYLAYFTVMSALLWPAVHYHNLLTRSYQFLEPYLMRFEHSLNIKRGGHRRRSKKGKKGRGRRSGETMECETDSEDDDGSFMPSADPGLSATLARAITDSESESHGGGGESTGHTPRLPLTPAHGPSRSHSNDNLLMHDSDDDTVAAFLPSLDGGSIPSLDLIDHSLSDLQSLADLQMERSRSGHDGSVEDPANVTLLHTLDVEASGSEDPSECEGESTTAAAGGGDMDFVSGHFRESSSEESERVEKQTRDDELEERLADGLEAPPDVEDEDEEAPAGHRQLLAAAATVSTLWGSTLSGMSYLRDTVRRGMSSADSAAEQVAGAGALDEDVVDAEFEFLSEADLEEAEMEAAGADGEDGRRGNK